jgi:hypothetical protein
MNDSQESIFLRVVFATSHPQRMHQKRFNFELMQQQKVAKSQVNF